MVACVPVAPSNPMFQLSPHADVGLGAPVNRSLHIGPVIPVGPVAPVTPSFPVSPVIPVGPVAPFFPYPLIASGGQVGYVSLFVRWFSGTHVLMVVPLVLSSTVHLLTFSRAMCIIS